MIRSDHYIDGASREHIITVKIPEAELMTGELARQALHNAKGIIAERIANAWIMANQDRIIGSIPTKKILRYATRRIIVELGQRITGCMRGGT